MIDLASASMKNFFIQFRLVELLQFPDDEWKESYTGVKVKTRKATIVFTYPTTYLSTIKKSLNTYENWKNNALKELSLYALLKVSRKNPLYKKDN